MFNNSRLKDALKSRLLIKPLVDSDPRSFSNRKRGTILFCLTLCVCTPGFSSTIYFPGLPDITSELNAPPIATTLTAALFILAIGVAPIFWASLSEFYQVRRVLFLFSMLIFAAASIGCVFMNNIWGLVVLRCIQSVGSSCGQSVGAGVVADCYPVEKRGAAFGKYFFGVFFGPLVGPIIGGFLIMSEITWRATFWFCFAFALLIFCLVFLFFPETYRINSKFDIDLLDPKHSQDLNTSIVSLTERTLRQDESTSKKFTEEIENDKKISASSSLQSRKNINPFAPFLLLKHPYIFIASLASGIAFGSMFVIETVTPGLYESVYGFNSWKTGLSYISGGIGNFLAAYLSGKTSDKLLLRARKIRGGKAVVEDRLSITLWPAFFFFMPFGLLLFGWATEYKLSVWAPIIGFGLLNFGMNLVMTSTSNYLVDNLPGEGASVTAAANFVRMVIACVLTIAANPMVGAIGSGYTSVFLASLCLVGSILLVFLKLYGEKLRKYSGHY